MKTTIMLEYYKSGDVINKFYFYEKYESEIEPYETLAIIREAIDKFPQIAQGNYTIEMFKGQKWNKYLVISPKE